ncbi:MAG TPA: DNA gyrase subunit A, partial [Bacteroidales bacterium]|nr:DNA gyrase subunit A [Bacteroidales bacterium]
MESEELDKKQEQSTSKTSLKTISGMYENWYLDYASYVILERAIPHIRDGLKPVQRRILHSMYELEDGRYNKVANIIGNTMKYHPHGDASIGDALVQLGQKELLIDTQGNWGNILTGDTAAAPRYIEARLSKLALETAFNPKITPWKISYDGRNKEPIYLPIKFPLLLIQGIEGIAVSLQVRILPHNFNEVLDACISYLKGESFTLYPDFPSGGLIDVTNYNDGQKKGQIISRAKLEILDNKSIVIREIPYGVTTGQLIDSIVDATNRGHLKIKKIEDNTASEVEITLILSPDVTPDQTIDALYAFTKCEVKISTNCVVIDDNTPVFLSISELLKETTD